MSLSLEGAEHSVVTSLDGRPLGVLYGVVRHTVEAYGRPLAYGVDNHPIVLWVTH